jgi:hypothetical protein
MVRFLRECFGKLSPEESRRRGRDGTFSPVEHVWHLADLEREGFGVRIHRLLAETHPQLADFDGARIASERRYQSLSLAEGLIAFEQAREANLSALRTVPESAWSRSGTQDGVGVVALRDIPDLMRQHDAAHCAEIAEWLQACASGGGARR